MRYFLHLNYNGSNFKGWQVQPDATTIQGEIEAALSKILQQKISITGCGRTDAGVHAHSFYAHFDYEESLPEKCLLRLNKLLPPSIGIADVIPVLSDAHCRFDASARTYKYFIHFQKNAFLQDRSYWMHSFQFDIHKMNAAAAILKDYSDFTTFEKKGSDNRTSICKIEHAEWTKVNEHQWCFTIAADRFLRNMVRRIVGTLLMIGLDRISIKDMEEALKKRDILEVNIAPPAHGLFLWEIKYPANLFP